MSNSRERDLLVLLAKARLYIEGATDGETMWTPAHTLLEQMDAVFTTSFQNQLNLKVLEDEPAVQELVAAFKEEREREEQDNPALAEARLRREQQDEQDHGFAEAATAFIQAFSDFSERVHDYAKLKGFWDVPNGRNKGEMIALMHSELSECLEAVRADKPGQPVWDTHLPNFLAESVELGDVIIRIMDYSRAYRLNVGEAVVAKHHFNLTRPYKHGKKF